MTLKCKNPYFDENIDRKFVFLLYSVLIAKGINLGEKFDGLFISDNKVGILETHLDYEMAVLKEASVYEAFEHCIPDGMRYNKEFDKLVPDVVENQYCLNTEKFYSKQDGEKILNKFFNKNNSNNHRNYNIGSSNYSSMNIQPWDIWKDWQLDPWDADIVKRISRTKEIPGKTFEEARIEDYEKIKHICDEKISQLKEVKNAK